MPSATTEAGITRGRSALGIVHGCLAAMQTGVRFPSLCSSLIDSNESNVAKWLGTSRAVVELFCCLSYRCEQ